MNLNPKELTMFVQQAQALTGAIALVLLGAASAALAAQPDEALVKPVITTFEITGSGTAEGQGTEVLNINSAGTLVGTYLDSS